MNNKNLNITRVKMNTDSHSECSEDFAASFSPLLSNTSVFIQVRYFPIKLSGIMTKIYLSLSTDWFIRVKNNTVM